MLTLKITRESISEILFGLKSGTAMGYDEIPNEFLKYGGKAMLSSLVDLFTAISDFEQIPSDWQNGIIKPIHISGSLFELDNYRGIPYFESKHIIACYFVRLDVMDKITDLTFKTWINAFVFTDTIKMLLKRGFNINLFR
jgi:hypothetical protein